MHRLVQAVTLAQLPADQAQAWRQAARSLTERRACPQTRSSREPGPSGLRCCPTCRPHTQPTVTPWHGWPASWGKRQLHGGARSLAADRRRPRAGARRRAPRHADRPRRPCLPGPGRRGIRPAARDQFAALLPVIERVLGAEHPGTLTARANLARWTGEAGDPAAARDQFAALLPVFEKVLGVEHHSTLTARANLGYWTGHAESQAEHEDHPGTPKSRPPASDTIGSCPRSGIQPVRQMTAGRIPTPPRA